MPEGSALSPLFNIFMNYSDKGAQRMFIKSSGHTKLNRTANILDRENEDLMGSFRGWRIGQKLTNQFQQR